MGTIHAASSTAVSSTTDSDPSNNTFSMAHTVVASYDPNDKQLRTSSGLSDDVYLVDIDAVGSITPSVSRTRAPTRPSTSPCAIR